MPSAHQICHNPSVSPNGCAFYKCFTKCIKFWCIFVAYCINADPGCLGILFRVYVRAIVFFKLGYKLDYWYNKLFLIGNEFNTTIMGWNFHSYCYIYYVVNYSVNLCQSQQKKKYFKLFSWNLDLKCVHFYENFNLVNVSILIVGILITT